MNGLEIAEERIAQCKADKISYLSLSDLELDDIPSSIAELTWLGALSISRNNITISMPSPHLQTCINWLFQTTI